MLARWAARTSRALPLGFVVLAFQADWQMCITTNMTNKPRWNGITGPLLLIRRALTLPLAASVRRKALRGVRFASGRNEDSSKSVQRSANFQRKLDRLEALSIATFAVGRARRGRATRPGPRHRAGGSAEEECRRRGRAVGCASGWHPTRGASTVDLLAGASGWCPTRSSFHGRSPRWRFGLVRERPASLGCSLALRVGVGMPSLVADTPGFEVFLYVRRLRSKLIGRFGAIP